MSAAAAPGPPPAAGLPAPQGGCPNCAEPLLPRAAGAAPAYCPACGQETRILPPTLGEFVQQFGGAYLSTEGALWRTLKLLLTRPGELTRLYLAGRRKHYVLPLRLYLTISLLVLLALRLAGGAMVKVDEADLAEAGKPRRNFSVLTMSDGSGAGLRDGVFYCTGLPAWVCQRLQQRIDIDPKAVAGEIERFRERFVGNLGGAMFLLLPTFALWLKLAYLNRRLRYTEHLVFALHLHALGFLLIGLGLLPLPGLQALTQLALPVYAWLALRRVYGGRWWPRLLRVGFVGLLYLFTLGIAMVGVALWSFLL